MLYGFSGVILQGALVTLELAISSVVLAVIIGLIGAGGKLSQNRLSGLIFEGYTTLIRGVPDLVLMLLIFYGLQIALNTVTEAMGVGQIDIDPMVAGIITLGFIYGAYFTETFRGAFMAVPKGHIEAATAFGFTRGQVFRRIMFPAMMRYAPAGHWQQLAGDPQIYRTGFVTRHWKMWSKPPNWQAKVPGTVLFRHRLWRDLPWFSPLFPMVCCCSLSAATPWV